MVEFIHYNNIDNTPAVLAFLKFKMEMLETRQYPYSMSYKDGPCMAAMDGEICVGFIHYNYDKSSAKLFIMNGWVAPTHRKAGIYKTLWDMLVAEAERLQCRTIVGNVHDSNERMKEVMGHMGRVKTSETYTYVVNPLNSGEPA